jgi:alpha-glucosidase
VGAKQAPVAAMLLLTLPGTLTIYYGEEIGMTNLPIPPEDVQDPAEKNEPGIGMGRDPERTPMQWDETPRAGFTTGKPWLPVASDHAAANVAAQEQDDRSMLHLYRELIRLRHDHPALIDGKMQSVGVEGQILRYERVNESEHLLILLNLGHHSAQVRATGGVILKSTGGDRGGERVESLISLKSDEGLIVEIDDWRG